MLAAMAVLALFAGLLVGRLGQLQLTDAADGARIEAGDGTERVAVPALRGRILDRAGRPLVDNDVQVVVTLDRAVLADADDGGRALLRRLAAALDLPYDQVQARTTLCGAPGAAKPPRCWAGSALVPVPVAEGVEPATALRLSDTSERFPGVSVTTEAVRAHPGRTAAQVLGYLTRPDAARVEASDGSIGERDLVGAAGLEQQYDERLRGRPGEQTVAVDARGVATGEISRRAPSPGQDLVTTLDLRVQRATEKALTTGVGAARARGQQADSGAAVVLDLADGGILASASAPSYDPSVWSGGISQTQYDALVSGPDSPLVDRVADHLYPPASTFKVVTLPGAVAAGVDLQRPVDCASSYTIGNRVFRNFESRAYGQISWRRAIEVSCDTVFYQVAEQVWRAQGGLDGADDGDPLIGAARALGLGERTGVDLPSESPGRIPDRAWKQEYWESTKADSCARARDGYPEIADAERARYLQAVARESCQSGYQFRPGDEVNLSIGQGDVLTTPLQMARVYGAIASDGELVSPHLASAFVDGDGARQEVPTPAPASTELAGRSGPLLRAALEDVVTSGTAKGAFAGFPLARWPVAGKTGTGEVYGEEDTAWFVSYAPADRPRYVVAVAISQGGTGGGSAAPIARDIHDQLRRLDSSLRR